MNDPTGEVHSNGTVRPPSVTSRMRSEFRQRFQAAQTQLNQHRIFCFLCFRQDGTVRYEDSSLEIPQDRGQFVQQLFSFWGRRHAIPQHVTGRLSTYLLFENLTFEVQGWPGGLQHSTRFYYFGDRFSRFQPEDWTTIRGVFVVESITWNERVFSQEFDEFDEDNEELPVAMIEALRPFGFVDAHAYDDAFGAILYV